MHRILCATIACLALYAGGASAATEIDFFFPVPVQGRLSNEMQRLVSEFHDLLSQQQQAASTQLAAS